MAQIVISTIDPVNGSISTTIKLKDEHLQRIYKAYKCNQASNYLNRKKEEGEVLEGYETVEYITENIPTQHILDQMVNQFVNDISKLTQHIELRTAQEEYLNKTEKISWE